MKIYTVVFGGERFDRLIGAFENSCAANCPDTEVVVIHGTRPAKREGYANTYTDNTYKLHIWRDIAQTETEPHCFLDADTIVLHSLDHVFDEGGGDWDIGITRRRHKSWLNGGAVYVNPNAQSRAFLEEWCRVNDYFYSDVNRMHEKLKRHYGLNQTACVHMLDCIKEPTETAKTYTLPDDPFRGCKVHMLDCATWNNCDQHWKDYDPESTAVVHIKGGLREHIFAYRRPGQWPDHYKAVRDEFFKYDPENMGEAYDWSKE